MEAEHIIKDSSKLDTICLKSTTEFDFDLDSIIGLSTKEQKLLEIAAKLLALNNQVQPKLTGSLMLAIRGLKKRRIATDIDILCSEVCQNGPGFPIVTDDFKLVHMSGSKSEVDAVSFINIDGIKVDFMFSEEEFDVINDIPCAQSDNLIRAKLHYASNDATEDSRKKHLLDVSYLLDNNNFTIEDYTL